MSAVEDKNGDIMEQQTNETSDAEGKTHSEEPASDSPFLALDEIASKSLDDLKPEPAKVDLIVKNTESVMDNTANEEQNNSANCPKPVNENMDLTDDEREHVSNFEDLEEVKTDNLERVEPSVENVNNECNKADNFKKLSEENSNTDLILSNDAIQERGLPLPENKKDSSLKVGNIESPLKDDGEQQKETSSKLEKVCETEENLLEKGNKVEICSIENEILENKTKDEESENGESLHKKEDRDIITKEVKEKVGSASEKKSLDVAKAATNESGDDIVKSVTSNNDDDLLALESDDISKEIECEEIPALTATETFVEEKSASVESAKISEAITSESDACKELEREETSKVAENEITAESVAMETENVNEIVATETIAVEDTVISETIAEHNSTDKEVVINSKSSTIADDDKAKENVSVATAIDESVERMDTCDSQESTNLVIDEETSNITEIKTDDDTNMEVDLTENTKGQPTKSVEIMDTEIDNSSKTEKEPESATEKSNTDVFILDKSKDDDVIPVEQSPVPVIEIEDEDDIEPASKTKTSTVNDKQSEVVKADNEKAKNSTADSAAKDQNDEILLVKSSEKPSDDDIIITDIPKSSDEIEETNDEVYYKKECINYECPHKHKQYFKVPQFAFSYFKVTKKKFKTQYICADCYDKALEMYEEFCGLISAKQPLLLENIPSGRQEFVEIIDSSDDEESCNNKTNTVETTRTAFSKNDLTLIKTELNDTIRAVLNRVDIQNQLTWSKTILTERLKRLEMETEYVDSELKLLQKKADKMHEGLYSCPKIKIRQLQPLDLNSGKFMNLEPIQKEVQPIPPVGEIERPSIQHNGVYYAVKNNPIASWVPCRIIEQVENSLINSYTVKTYKIKFTKNQTLGPKTVSAKYLAYYDPPAVRLPIGTRVIAYFDATSLARGREKINVQSAFYPGIIAEPLKPNNKFRYLIFYDDGYTQYVYHKDVRLVCHVSDCVWEDVHPASRDFIQKYLTQYSINRPMVQTQKGQSMNTESNGYWLHARVVDIDCSLVLMQFEGSKSHTEWIYRGSLRLGPVFKEYQKSLQKNSSMPVSRLPRRTEPFIRYTEDEETSSTQQQQQQQQSAEKSSDGNRAVARKTFGRPESMMNSAHLNSYTQHQQQQQPVVKHLNNSTIYVEDENKPKGKVVYYTAKRNLPPCKYNPHKCIPSCQFQITHNLSAYSPLSKPLLSGWERFIIRQKIKRVVTYRAPCGKILRNMKELHNYLRATRNVLNVDNFDFSHEISCLAEYVIESAIIQKRDISGGQEKMAIPLVNYYDNTLPPECKYSAKVIPTEGVHINTNPEFLVGCDCEDDCIDKSKCSCWQLTLAGAKYGNPNAPSEEVGYQYRRLLDHVPTGIYECNANCKCKSSCLNRVVQNSLTMKLQVFKTSNRGWGLRCINDIPRGSFVCVYAGHLLTEAKANEGGQDAGDEYFAELDYIEVAEQIKEGYESDVEPPEPEEEEPYNPELDDDNDFTPSKSFLTRAKQKQNALKSTRSNNQDEESQERQVINFNPNADMNEDSVRENSIRKLYGRDEACYVMDAKISGNLGRYFNHSCAPNMFVQNVFVDTHDLRFPNVAFFSSCNIRAGTELTWNYNYEVGVVPGKVLYCQCGAANCRLRLL